MNGEVMFNYVVILIPAFEPNEKLKQFAESIIGTGISHVIVVDDGSGEICQELFSSIEIYSRAKIISWFKQD